MGEEEEVVSAMSTIITNVGTIVTGAIDWMGDYLSVITASGNEILLLFVLIPVVGLGIGLVRRMIRI